MKSTLQVICELGSYMDTPKRPNTHGREEETTKDSMVASPLQLSCTHTLCGTVVLLCHRAVFHKLMALSTTPKFYDMLVNRTRTSLSE
jgi:hypothetical protein